MISYQNSSSPCMNFKRCGLVWKSVAILFHFNAKIILCLKYRHKNVTKVELDYQEKSYFMFVLQVLPQKRQLDVKIAVWFPWFYQIFREMSAIVIVVTNYVRNVV